MQTFLPFPGFPMSAYVLDRQHLNNQPVECKQILNALLDRSRGWRHHPATLMWKGYEHQLCHYAIAVCNEQRRRGCKDNLREWFQIERLQLPITELPWWLGWEDFHSRHRAALLYKHPAYYNQHGWKEEPRIDYLWPSYESHRQLWVLSQLANSSA